MLLERSRECNGKETVHAEQDVLLEEQLLEEDSLLKNIFLKK